MPRYRTDGSVIFVEKRRKDGKSRGIMYRKTDYSTESPSLSLTKSNNVDCSIKQEETNYLGLK